MERQHLVAEDPNKEQILVAALLRLFDNNSQCVKEQRDPDSLYWQCVQRKESGQT